jgi:hypothetical protein
MRDKLRKKMGTYHLYLEKERKNETLQYDVLLVGAINIAPSIM